MIRGEGIGGGEMCIVTENNNVSFGLLLPRNYLASFSTLPRP